MGTADFLSPELVRGIPYGKLSDAWAVGVILFTLLALERPFAATTMLGLATQITYAQPRAPAVEALRACGHPAALVGLVSKEALLNPDPERRMSLESVLEAYPLEEQ